MRTKYLVDIRHAATYKVNLHNLVTLRRKILYFIILFTLMYSSVVVAQVHINLTVTTPSSESLQNSELTVTKDDSTIVFAIIPSNYQITLPSAGDYDISVAHMGYSPYSLRTNFSNDTTLAVVLNPKTFELGEVVVKGQAARKITATGEIFQLSQKAKKSGDPFKALSEIPLLDVDVVNQKVTTNSGEPLLVLIDGKLQNTGIKPIDPKFIDRVEISEVVSARFLKMGVNKILNIRLRKDRPLYVYTDLRTRHDIPLRDGFGGANFEVGRKKFAVSGSAFYTYLHHDKSEFERREKSTDVSRLVAGENINNNHSWEGSLLMKWIPRESDYFSVAVKGQLFSNTTESHREGQYMGKSSYPLFADYGSDMTSKGILTGLYHEHTFKNNSILTSYFQYNLSGSTIDQRLYEQYNHQSHETPVTYDTRRNQYILNIDFDTQDQPYGEINLGNQFEYTSDKDKNLLVPTSLPIYTHLWSNYTYAGYMNSWRKLYYMASVGLENLGVQVEDHSNVCWRPRVSSSVSWQLPHRQMLRFSYNLDNTLPPSSSLNMLNTSTNPMLRLEGNPDLIPEQTHSFNIKYDIDVKHVRISLIADHSQQSNIIEPYIFSNGETQVQSYRNNGTYKEMFVGGNARYSGNKLIVFAAANHTWKSFNGQPTKAVVGVSGYVRWDFGNFFVYSKLGWKNREYTPIATIHYENPVEAHVQIAWQATQQLYLSLGLPYFWGVKSQTTTIDQPIYQSWQHDRFKGMSLRPWLLISWTLRKNAKEVIPGKMPNL